MKLILTVILSTLFFDAASFAQTPAQIDVTSLTISQGSIMAPTVSMTATGLPAPYQSPLTGEGGGRLFSFTETASRIGKVFETSFAPNSFNRITAIYPYGTSSNRYVKLTLVGTSPDVVLYPTILRKKQIVTFEFPANVKGKVEVIDGNTLIAVDDDVDLKGLLKVEFWQYLYTGANPHRRAFDLKGLMFSYAQ